MYDEICGALLRYSRRVKKRCKCRNVDTPVFTRFIEINSRNKPGKNYKLIFKFFKTEICTWKNINECIDIFL